MAKAKLIIVSNRLPISVSQQNGKLVYKPSSGGLATAMSSLKDKRRDRTWIGWPGISADVLTAADKSAITKKLRSFGYVPIFLTTKQIKDFYGGYCNSTLWPLFHYFQYLTRYDERYWSAYRQVNSLFSKAVVAEADKTSHIWIHDYHLMLLPSMARAAMPKASIGYFMHIPFPSYEIFRLLPDRKEILEGMLGADLVGFHIYDYARYFLSSTYRILGIENRNSLIQFNDRVIKTDAFPIGIDYQLFKKAVGTRRIKKEIELIKKSYGQQKIVLSIDRLDYTKGILQRLEAFQLLLKEQPKLRAKIALIMITVPSRTSVASYQNLKRAIDQSIGRINGKYATAHWTPITYQFSRLTFEQMVALYSQADIAMVTPFRDGMNLVAKEYVATKQDNEGVLVLSEMAGAMDELQESIHVNPHSVRSIKRATIEALEMPKKEQRRRLDVMQQRLSTYTVQDWAADFIEQLDEVKKLQAEQQSKLLDSKATRLIKSSFKKAAKRLIILDYDGTIQKFFKSPDPNLAKPSKDLVKIIKKLAGQPATKLCIVSGRTRYALESWFGKLPIDLIAEHGAWMKTDRRWSQKPSSFRKYKALIMPILERYVRRTVGSSIEEKDHALVWHYRNVPTELAYVRSQSLIRELRKLTAKTDLEAHEGSKIIEVKPNQINKGGSVEQLLATDNFDFIVCIGDDYTDEDMYNALPEDAYTIKVGLGQTNARFRLPDIDATLNFLKKIASG
ncbi:hypothetical protein A3F65_00880 [Candidatus Saccharibacteria bacterium RIFCSPHIGHO2_12_FULL_47_16b]|nr:MAG: hypothetical protein A3F65_00880 [Candidatus Saccharibacteria bacterium RIFCSPHIGHO2_12_FULL_47_16b]